MGKFIFCGFLEGYGYFGIIRFSCSLERLFNSNGMKWDVFFFLVYRG